MRLLFGVRNPASRPLLRCVCTRWMHYARPGGVLLLLCACWASAAQVAKVDKRSLSLVLRVRHFVCFLHNTHRGLRGAIAGEGQGWARVKLGGRREEGLSSCFCQLKLDIT